jgi:hypothetical protein
MSSGEPPMSVDTPTIAQALQALSRSSAARTKASRLRELLPEIEAAQAAGVKHEHILETLNGHGFDLSKKSYSVMLWRLRQQAKRLGAPGSSPAIPPASAAAAGNAPTASGPSSIDAASPPNPSLSASTPAPQAAPRPGEPQRFDWETLKNTRPEW